jgi:transcriptional regulator of met regulon
MKLIIKNIAVFSLFFSFAFKSFSLENKISDKKLIVKKDEHIKNIVLSIPIGSNFYLLRDNSGKKMSVNIKHINNYQYNYESDM